MTRNHTPELAVSCQALTKSYDQGENQVHALRGIDLHIHTGELLMLVGPSGCGKTTLISIIAGILDQDAGSCSLYGRELRALAPKERVAFRAKTVGFVFQAFNLVPALTATENVAIPLLINGVKRGEAMERAMLCLRQVGLAGREQSLPSQLSGGQQQRVAIARAMVHGPRLIVCDEPTSALDHATGHRVMEILKGVVAGHDRTLVIVTHDSRIFDFADRIAFMDDGHIDRIECKNRPGLDATP